MDAGDTADRMYRLGDYLHRFGEIRTSHDCNPGVSEIREIFPCVVLLATLRWRANLKLVCVLGHCDFIGLFEASNKVNYLC